MVAVLAYRICVLAPAAANSCVRSKCSPEYNSETSYPAA